MSIERSIDTPSIDAGCQISDLLPDTSQRVVPRILTADSALHGHGSAHWDHSADPFEAAVRATRMPMVITNPRLPDNPIVFVNDAFCSLTGYAREEIMGRNCRFLQGPQSDQTSIARIRAALSAAEPIEIEVCNHRKNGEPFWCRVLIAPVFNASGSLEYFFGNQIDITSRRRHLEELNRHNADIVMYSKRLAERTRELAVANDRLLAESAELALAEASLLHARKMEAVGRLAGGIAHDFNNILTVIMGSLELMQRRIAAGRFEDLDNYTSAAITSGRRAAELTQRLLGFARRQPLESVPVDVNLLLEGMEDMLRRTIGPMIALDLFPAPETWMAICDPNQLENAVLNLAINSRDAMPDGGRLMIETANVTLDDDFSSVRGDEVNPGDYIRLSVTDTGTGMVPDVKAMAVEPFFTTKPVGKGTGLGLSMIYGFVKQSGGDLRIQSEPGEGTTITLYLPRYRERVMDDTA